MFLASISQNGSFEANAARHNSESGNKACILQLLIVKRLFCRGAARWSRESCLQTWQSCKRSLFRSCLEETLVTKQPDPRPERWKLEQRLIQTKVYPERGGYSLCLILLSIQTSLFGGKSNSLYFWIGWEKKKSTAEIFFYESLNVRSAGLCAVIVCS